MFSKKLNFDIIQKDPNTYYVVKDPNQPPLAIAFDKNDAIEFILPYADTYLNQELGLIKDPIGRHDDHNDYYSTISYNRFDFIIHKLVNGDLEKFHSCELDGLIDQVKKSASVLKE